MFDPQFWMCRGSSGPGAWILAKEKYSGRENGRTLLIETVQAGLLEPKYRPKA
jgi:hypothetical protein